MDENQKQRVPDLFVFLDNKDIPQEDKINLEYLTELRKELREKYGNIEEYEKAEKSAYFTRSPHCSENEWYAKLRNDQISDDSLKVIIDIFKEYCDKIREQQEQVNNWLEDARAKINSGNYNEAIDKISQVLIFYPSGYYNPNKYIEQSLDIINNALTSAPQNNHLKGYKLSLEAQNLYNKKEYEKALFSIKSACNIENLPDYQNILGNLEDKEAERYYYNAKQLLEGEQYDKALAAIDNAIKINSFVARYNNLKNTIEDNKGKKAGEWFQKAGSLLSKKQFIKAREAINEALKLYPDFSTYKELKERIDEKIKNISGRWYKEATGLLSKRQFDDAIKAINEALELNPDYSPYIELKNGIENAKNSESIRQTANDSYLKAQTLRKGGNFDGALESVKDALTKINEAIRLVSDISVLDEELKKAIEERKQYEDEKKRIEDQKQETADKWNQEAKDLVSKRLFSDALDANNKALNLYPANASYKNLKNGIENVIEADRIRQTANNLHQEAQALLKKEAFDDAIMSVNGALESINGALSKLNEAISVVPDVPIFDEELKKAIEERKQYEDEKKGIEEKKQATADKWHQEAKELLVKREFDDALEANNKALKLYSDNSSYKKLKNGIEKVKEAQEIRQIANNLHHEALNLLNREAFDDALNTIDGALVKNKEALIKIQEAINAAPDAPVFEEEQKSALEERERYENEKKVIEEKKQKSADKSYLESVVLLSQKKTKEALEAINQALKLYPDNLSYKNLKKGIENVIGADEQRLTANDSYREAQTFMYQEEYDNALNKINDALETSDVAISYLVDSVLIVLDAPKLEKNLKDALEKDLKDALERIKSLFEKELKDALEKRKAALEKIKDSFEEEQKNHFADKLNKALEILKNSYEKELQDAINEREQYKVEKKKIDNKIKAEEYYRQAQLFHSLALNSHNQNSIYDIQVSVDENLSNFEKALDNIDKAIELYPDDSKYSEEKEKISNDRQAEILYREAAELLDDRNYKEALNRIDDAIRIRNFGDYFDLKEIIERKIRRNKQIKGVLAGIAGLILLFCIIFIANHIGHIIKVAKADRYCKQAIALHHDKKYDEALDAISISNNLFPDNDHYQSVKKTIEDDLAKSEEFCKQAESLFQEKKLGEALSAITSALKLYPTCNRYLDVKKTIDEKIAQAKTLFEQAKTLDAKNELGAGLKTIGQALDIYPGKRTYQTLRKTIKDKIAEADKLYEEAKILFAKKELGAASKTIGQALDIYRDNSQYQAFKKTIEDNIAEADKLYEQAKTQFADKELGDASKTIDQALDIYRDNNSYQTLKKAIEDKLAEADKLYKQAKTLLADEEFVKALTAIKKALSIYPAFETYQNLKHDILQAHADSYYNQAISLQKQAEKTQNVDLYDQALETIAKALELFPKNASYLNAKNEILQAKAEYYYSKAVERRQHKSYDLALKAIGEALMLYPDNNKYQTEQKLILSYQEHAEENEIIDLKHEDPGAAKEKLKELINKNPDKEEEYKQQLLELEKEELDPFNSF